MIAVHFFVAFFEKMNGELCILSLSLSLSLSLPLSHLLCQSSVSLSQDHMSECAWLGIYIAHREARKAVKSKECKLMFDSTSRLVD
jgi:hypothetical protein